MPIMPGVIVRIKRKSNTPNIGTHFIVISDGKYYIYAVKPF